MTYDALYEWAGSWGMMFLFALFIISIVYALWPSNKAKFTTAANLPLCDDDIADEETRS